MANDFRLQNVLSFQLFPELTAIFSSFESYYRTVSLSPIYIVDSGLSVLIHSNVNVLAYLSIIFSAGGWGFCAKKGPSNFQLEYR
jgi:hypothetical protein